MTDRCPTCGHRLQAPGYLTPRELDVLVAWWGTDSVKAAAIQAGVGEQRAKNMLARARIRNGVHDNDELLVMHFDAVRSLVNERMQHKSRGDVAA